MNPTLLPDAQTSSVKLNSKKSMGPVPEPKKDLSATYMGVLTTNKKFNFLRLYLITARQLHVEAYVFGPDDVNWERETVTGWTLLEDRGKFIWIRKPFPLPDVVYNQIKNRRDERRSDVIQLKLELEKRSILLFNSDFFNKKEIYDVLSETDIYDLLPVTYPFGSTQTFKDMMQEFPLLYLKPVGGSLGQGIVRVERGVRDYSVQIRHDEHNVVKKFDRMRELFDFLQKICGNKKYVLQQGIYLKQVDGGATDFRVHLHKDQFGQWNIVAIGGKVAGTGSITTHVHSGGRVMDATDVLNLWYEDRKNEMLHRLSYHALQVAMYLDDQLQGVFGELGLDMGIDQDDRIWLFEVNSKPGKAIFKIPSLKPQGVESARRIAEFALYLAKDRVG